MFAILWAQVAGGPPAEPEPQGSSLAWLCVLLVFIVPMFLFGAMSWRAQRQSRAFMLESRERSDRTEAQLERMIEVLESIEGELKQLNAGLAGAARGQARPTETAIRPPGSP